MYALFQLATQVVDFFNRNHRAIYAFNQTVRATTQLAKAAYSYYQSLPPETKAKIDDMVRRAVAEAAKTAVALVLNEIERQVVQLVGNTQVVADVKRLVLRGVEIGAEAALNEAHRS